MHHPILLSALIGLYGCAADENVADSVDAGAPDASPWDATDIQGRVCSVLDLRYPWACPPAQSVGSLSVSERLLDQEVITSDDGRFGFALPEGPRNASFSLQGENRVPILIEAAEDALKDVVIPSVAVGPWQGYLAVMDEQALALDSMAYVLVAIHDQAGARVEGAIVDAPGGVAGTIFYNLGDAFAWGNVGLTSSTGVALLTGVPVAEDRISLIVRAPNDRDVQTLSVPVAAGTLSILQVELNL